MPETALICRTPAAERWIGHYRERYDPPARRNVPAHVTILYPFMPPGEVTPEVIGTLAAIAAGVPRFAFTLREPRRFPLSLYLWPDPPASFAALTENIHRAFPAYPPFGGKFDVVVPHVTVAHGDESLLCEIDVELRIALPAGGIRAHCDEMILIEDSAGPWRTLHSFALG